MKDPRRDPTAGSIRSRRALAPAALTLVVLILGLIPLPGGRALTIRQSVRSPETNRAERDAGGGGYYEGLIGGGRDRSRAELALRLLGKPAHWVQFQDAGVARVMPADFLRFELKPDLDRLLYGHPFTTNAFGMRDRGTTRRKPEGTFRIALVGSSMDMGWGIGTEETYENRLEDWLNAHAARRGLSRRFEVLNFAVAAYGPAQRLESYRRKAAAFDPDVVIYSATMLDTRLAELHLCGLLRDRVDLRYDFLRRAVADAGITEEDLRHDRLGDLVRKDVVKTKLKNELWRIADESLGALAAECRSAGRPLLCLIVPRVGAADCREARTASVARQVGIAARHAVPLIDLSATFDDRDPAAIEIAAWDDHPNAIGHKLLFLALARELVNDPALYRTLFDVETGDGG